MKINKKWLKEKSACSEGYEWFVKRYKTDIDVCELLLALTKDEHFDWARWVFLELGLPKKQYMTFAIKCAELVLPVFEKKYPLDARPRLAIEAAKNWAKNPTRANAAAASAAGYAAYAASAAAAGYAGYAAYAAAAGYAAYAAYAGYAGYAAYAAAAAAYAAGDAGDAKLKITKFMIAALKAGKE